MMSRKMKLLSAAIGAAVLIATPALVRAVHKEGTPVAQARDRAHGHAYNADAVIGPDGKLIGQPLTRTCVPICSGTASRIDPGGRRGMR
jgi:hypothetical protein